MKKPTAPGAVPLMEGVAAAFLWLVLLAGCAAAPGRGAPSDKIAWPPPPLAPRIAWVQSISSSGDAGIVKGVWGRVLGALLGEEEAPIHRPYGIHVDRKKRILVADTGGRCVHVIDRGGGSYRLVTGTAEGGFLSPIGVTEDDRERVYLTDSAAGKVYRFSLTDPQAESFIAGVLKRPTGIAYSRSNGLLYVSDTVAGQVVAFTETGQEAFRFGVPGEREGEFNRPTDLAVDARGRVLVTDALNGRVQIFSGSGEYLGGFGKRGVASGTFAKPKGVAVDSRGQMHVCDALFDTVQLFNEAGELLLSYGSRGGGDGELWMPSGICIDADDFIYVADSHNKRIQIFRYFRDVP